MAIRFPGSVDADPLVDLRRPAPCRRSCPPRPTRPAEQRLEARLRVVEDGRLLLQDVDALLPARLLREQLLERAERAEVPVVEPEHALPGVDRLVGAAEDLALQLPELGVELDQLVVGSMSPAVPISIRRCSVSTSSSHACVCL